jgi:hypothetical protein
MLKMDIIRLKTNVLRLKMGVYRLKIDTIFVINFANFCETRNTAIQIYGIYRVLISSKFLRNIRSDSNFNRIFDYVHGTHCPTLQ